MQKQQHVSSVWGVCWQEITVHWAQARDLTDPG